MAASDQTARTIVMVLLSEVEIEVATRIVNKLRTHSKGSKSHTQMILRRVYEILLERQQ